MSLENEELNPNVEILDRMPLDYISHEEFTMSMEREANRKLKAEIRRKKKQKTVIKPKPFIIWTSEEGQRLFEEAVTEYIKQEYPLTPKECYDSNL